MTLLQRWRFARPLLACALLAATAVFTGCGGSEEAPAPAPEKATAAAPAETAAPAEAAANAVPAPAAAAAKAPAIAADAPSTLKALQFLPAEAQFGLAAPALNGLIATLLALDTRIDAVDLKAELDKAVEDLKSDAGVPDAQSLGDIALAKGLSLDAPIAVFADFSGSMTSLTQAAEAAKAAGDDSMEDADVAPPAIAAVIGVSDQAKAEAFIAEIVALDGTLSAAPTGTEQVGDVSVSTRGDYAHFFAGDQLVIGVASLVKGAAARVAAPATFRYGTSECPPTAPNEIVAVGYMERLLPLAKQFIEVAGKTDPSTEAVVKAQLEAFEKAFQGGPEDPAVFNLALSEKEISLSGRIDYGSHPGLVDITGPAAPLQLAQLLPADTLAMLSIGLTDVFKNQVKTQVLPAAQESATNPGLAQGLSMGNQVLDMLGNELTIGLAPVPNDFPAAYIMLSLSNPEPTKGLLQMLVPMMPDDTLKDYGISSIAAPIPVPLSIAFEGDMVLVSNNVDGMKAIIDHARAKTTSGYFAALQPALDPAVPRYQAIVLNTNLITDIVMPLMALAGGMDPKMMPVANTVGSVVREVRMVSEMDGTWNTSALTIALKDPA